MLSAGTFWSFVREFSPPGLGEVRSSEDSCAVGTDARASRPSSGRGRIHAASCDRGQIPHSNPMKWPRVLERRFAHESRHQLAINSSGLHIRHDVERFSFIRDWRATLLAASSSSGTRSPVPKYISSGV